jgi:hypothetical protein
LIWGTNVSATAFKETFQRFIQEYKEDVVEEDDFATEGEIITSADKPFYMRKLEEVSTDKFYYFVYLL